MPHPLLSLHAGRLFMKHEPGIVQPDGRCLILHEPGRMTILMSLTTNWYSAAKGIASQKQQGCSAVDVCIIDIRGQRIVSYMELVTSLSMSMLAM